MFMSFIFNYVRLAGKATMLFTFAELQCRERNEMQPELQNCFVNFLKMVFHTFVLEYKFIYFSITKSQIINLVLTVWGKVS